MPRECLPPHLRDKRHDDWPWPFRYVPRAWNAYCGDGPVWFYGDTYQSKPIPLPGFRSAHNVDKDGAKRKYRARTFKNGWHIRYGYRWDDSPGNFYYNWVIINISREYRNGRPV